MLKSPAFDSSTTRAAAVSRRVLVESRKFKLANSSSTAHLEQSERERACLAWPVARIDVRTGEQKFKFRRSIRRRVRASPRATGKSGNSSVGETAIPETYDSEGVPCTRCLARVQSGFKQRESRVYKCSHSQLCTPNVVAILTIPIDLNILGKFSNIRIRPSDLGRNIEGSALLASLPFMQTSALEAGIRKGGSRITNEAGEHSLWTTISKENGGNGFLR